MLSSAFDYHRDGLHTSPAQCCTMQELLAITIPGRLVADALRKPTTYLYLRGMFIRVREAHGYTLMRIESAYEGEELETYRDEEFLTVVTAVSSAAEPIIVKLASMSNSAPTTAEYETAKAAGILPTTEGANITYASWKAEAIDRPNDMRVVEEMLRLRRLIQSKSTRADPAQRIVAEKVYLERMLKIDWPPEVAEQYRQRLAEITSASNKLVQSRAATIESYVQKTQANKHSNRAVRRSSASSPKTRAKQRTVESSFWELCENDGKKEADTEKAENTQSSDPQTQILETAQRAKPVMSVLESLHAAIDAEPLGHILEELMK